MKDKKHKKKNTMRDASAPELSQWKADVADWSTLATAWAQNAIVSVENNQEIGSNPPTPPPPPPGMSYQEPE